MNNHCIYVLGTIAFLVASSVRAAADEQVIVALSLSENRSATGGIKILAEPTVAVTLGRPFSFHVGGEANARNGEHAVEFGTRVRGTISEHKADSLLVAIQLAVGHRVTDARNPDIDVVQTETLDLRTTMTIGQKKRIKCGRSQVLEIHVQPIPTKDDEPKR